MAKNKQQTQIKKIHKPRAAYAGFLFQTFLRRPFGYVIACLYVVYLAVILIIVPKILHLGPLFIWTLGGFNMPVFNLFFIAASAAALAVSIFRTGREDGTELSLSSKPLTKGTMVGIKVAVYLTIMVVLCALSCIITSLTLPIFGVYDDVHNIRGITYAKYVGLNLSVLIGNIINMLFFGAISVLISMVGGQVITMVGTVGVVFIMCLMNFIFPQVVTSSIEVLENKYDAQMLSFSCNTLNQYEKQDGSGVKHYATIQCVTDELQEEKIHFDTNEYWLRAERESGTKATNYIDFARQLSSLYNAFGLDDTMLKEAGKLAIGANKGYRYNIIPETHVDRPETVAIKEYPIAYYGMTTNQGMQFPQVLVIGGDMNISSSNWYALSVLGGFDFNSTSILTLSTDTNIDTKPIINEYGRPYYKINELGINDKQKKSAENLYNQVLAKVKEDGKIYYDFDKDYFSDTALKIISNDTSEAFFTGKYEDLKPTVQHGVVSRIHMYWGIIAREWQIQKIDEYCSESGIKDPFPYTSKTVTDWFKANAEFKTQDQYYQHLLNTWIYKKGIQVRIPNAETKDYVEAYDKFVLSKLDYAETYSNLYQYGVSSYFTIATIMAVWSAVSVAFFATAVVIYKKTDLK